VSGSSPRPAAQPVALLHGLAGEYDGVELELGTGRVTLGRDPRVSQLVFSEEAASVSDRHCAVWFDSAARAVMVEDLWSAQGTFLATGRRLAGGEPQRLEPSDRFYLGQPDVLFEVRY